MAVSDSKLLGFRLLFFPSLSILLSFFLFFLLSLSFAFFALSNHWSVCDMCVSECQCVSKSRAAVRENNCRYYQTNQQALAAKSLGKLLEATCHLSSKSVLSCGQSVSI